MGLKSSAAATAAFAGVNGATYAASPDAAPLVLGVTMVLYLVFICFMAIMGAAGFMFGNFEDEDDRQDQCEHRRGAGQSSGTATLISDFRGTGTLLCHGPDHTGGTGVDNYCLLDG